MNPAPLPRRIAWFAPWTWKRRTQIVVGLLLVFVGYPLSLGPAVSLVVNGYLPGWIIITAYRPIYLLARESPSVSEWVRWYFSLFGI